MSDKDVKPIEPGYWIAPATLPATPPPRAWVIDACGLMRYVGADSETGDDGSAAHEPYAGCPLVPPLTDDALRRSNEALYEENLRLRALAHEPVTLGADAGPELSGNSLCANPHRYYRSECNWPKCGCGETLAHLSGNSLSAIEAHKLIAPYVDSDTVYRFIPQQVEWDGVSSIPGTTCPDRTVTMRPVAADDPTSKDGPNVAGDIERVIDHLVQGRTTRDQRKGVGDAIERAERDAAVGRALR